MNNAIDEIIIPAVDKPLPVLVSFTFLSPSIENIKPSNGKKNDNARPAVAVPFEVPLLLLLTCTSTKSRNYTLGKLIGEGKSKEEINNYIESTTIEGLYTLHSIKKLLRNKKIKMPIINLIYDIIVNEKEPSNLTKFLIEKE